jgi:thiosulfate dehydrogenase (quinone) large subunit
LVPAARVRLLSPEQRGSTTLVAQTQFHPERTTKETTVNVRHRSRGDVQLPDPNFVHPEVVAPETSSGRAFRYVAAALRLSLAWVFLWAFLDKAFGLGFATEREAAWINGGEPTRGFLEFGAVGPFKEFYNSLAGAAWADWLFMIGLAGIGIALTLGITMRIAAASGALMMLLMWTAVLPPENNPFMDDHIIYALVLVALVLVGAGRTLGLGKQWERIPFVAKNGWLK